MDIANMNYPVSENLKKIINNKGLIQKWVATAGGYKNVDITNMINGRKLIKPRDVSNLANILEVTPNDLYGVKPKKETKQ